MQNPELVKQYKKINKLIEDTQQSTDGNFELQGHWGRYLCILVSGFLENAISEVYVEFVNSAASPHVTEYTRKSLNKIQNPKSNKFIEVAYQFKKEWGEALELFFKDDASRKEAIDSIMNNRHLIAHGKQSSISVHRVREYFTKSIEVIEFIENQCSNKPV